jgi:hypothetical protein
MHRLALTVLFACAALGQDLSRTFQLKNTSARGMQEIATTLHSVFDIQQLSVDGNVSTLTVTGNADQIALAEWLIPKLDVLPGASTDPQKYLFAGNNDDVVEIFELKNASLQVNLQELLTNLRTVADIQKIYQSTAPRILIMRADASHIASAEFMVSQLDQPAGARQTPTIQTYQMTGANSDTVIVYGLANAASDRDLQEILTTLRTVLDIQKIYQQSAPKLLAIRGSADQIQMAEWLIPKLDVLTASASGNEAPMPGGKDDVVRVYYLAQPMDTQGLNNLLNSIHKTAMIMKAYIRTTPPVVVVRGTADQVAVAGNLIAGEGAAQ